MILALIFSADDNEIIQRFMVKKYSFHRKF